MVMVMLDDLKLVDVTLWKLAEALAVTPSRLPLTRTTNSADGGASNATKKLPLSWGVTVPLVSSVPSSFTRNTSVSVMESFPVKVSNRLTLAPGGRAGVWNNPPSQHLLSFHYRIWDEFPGQQTPRLDPATSPQSQRGSLACSHLQIPKWREICPEKSALRERIILARKHAGRP